MEPLSPVAQPGYITQSMIIRIALLTLLAAMQTQPTTAFRAGSSPQLAIDVSGTIRMVFGRGDTVFVATSRDQGLSFQPAEVVGIVRDMHLGNTRGPVVASSQSSSMIAATDKQGNTHLFRLDHRTNLWRQLPRPLNTVPGSAPEGLGTLAADSADTFYSVWLDYRESKQTHIYFARIDTAVVVNKRIYASPDGHVCECCRPSIAVSGRNVAVMFRNWVAGNRDMYLIRSTDFGTTFGAAEKLGTASWKLDACPMDGGALALDGARFATVWRRELEVLYSATGSRERRIGSGRNPMLSQHSGVVHLVWQDGPRVVLALMPSTAATTVGEGRLPQVLTMRDGRALVAWENQGTVHFRRM